MQRLCKYKNRGRGVIYGSASRLYMQYKRELNQKRRSTASTVALQVVGSDGKGSLESETVKYGHESHGTRT
jgi:hypothetical protein